jgi:sulfur-oxidizing protein SoxZ
MSDEKIRIVIPDRVGKDEAIEVRLRLDHPMESGMRIDSITKMKVPRYYIKGLKVFYGDREVSHMALTPGISHKPVIGFMLRAGNGGRLRVEIEDNKGKKSDNTAEIKVS